MESRPSIPLLTWPMVQDIVNKGDLSLLGRSEAQQAEYDDFRAQCRQQWKSMSDFILFNKFGFEYGIEEETGKKYVDRSLLQSCEDRISIRTNDFPYHFENGIKHFIVWKIGSPLSEVEIVDAIGSIRDSLQNVVGWEKYINPPNLKSIPEVDHAHILFYCCDCN